MAEFSRSKHNNIHAGQYSETEQDAFYADRLVPLYRYGKGVDDHLYTTDPNEIGVTKPNAVGRHNYVFESIVGGVYNLQGPKPPNTLPFYRYVNIKHPSCHHFYTTNSLEIGTDVTGVVVGDWKCEGSVGYIYTVSRPHTQPLYRYCHASHGAHFYTTNPNEIGTITPGAIGNHNFKCEGIAGYIVTPDSN